MVTSEVLNSAQHMHELDFDMFVETSVLPRYRKFVIVILIHVNCSV